MQSLRPVSLYIIYVYEIHLQSYYFFLNKVFFSILFFGRDSLQAFPLSPVMP